MPRHWLLVLLFAAACNAALLPDQFGTHKATAPAAAPEPSPPYWQEYGFAEAETRPYASERRQFSISAFRFADPTGAAAAFDAARPANASASRVASLAAVYPGGQLIVFGNYLLRIDGWQPPATELVDLAKALPKVSRASLPILRGYLPARGRVPNSERYILGPASLAAFAPAVPAEVAAFEQSAEAAAARYRTPAGEIAVVLFTYPTPQIARERAAAFEAVPGAVVKRTGPLIAIVPTPPTPDAANSVLAAIEYRPEFMWAESVREPRQENVGEMIIAILTLAGILILGALTFGLLFAGVRVFGKRFGIGPADGGFIDLNLRGK